jgi:hypothetical protein
VSQQLVSAAQFGVAVFVLLAVLVRVLVLMDVAVLVRVLVLMDVAVLVAAAVVAQTGVVHAALSTHELTARNAAEQLALFVTSVA